VIAVEQGFYRGARQRVGAEFEISETDLKKDAAGNPVLPKWVVPATVEQRARLADAARFKQRREVEALVAVAGPKRAGTAGVRQVNTGLANAAAEPEAPKAPVMDYGEVMPAPLAEGPKVKMVPAESPSLF
jgi:hypothetical protein